MAEEKEKSAPDKKSESSPNASGKTAAPSNSEEKSAASTTGQKRRNRPSNVVEITGELIDKIAAEKIAQSAGKEKPEPTIADSAPAAAAPTSPVEDVRPERETPIAELDKRKKQGKNASRPAKDKVPAVKEEGKPGSSEKEAPAVSDASLAERKEKLEKELREKYGIPKSDKLVEPWVAPEVEQVIRIPHEKLHSFKNHPFNVDTTTTKFKAFVTSIRAHGVTQPAVVRPDGKGSYEIVSGHRRDAGSIAAEIPYTPCIVRALNDDQAIQQMVEDNVNNREITRMELARALKQQLDSIKHQGARQALDEKNYTSDIDKRSNEVVAERNGMSVKQVQRHIALTKLIKPLQDLVDGKEMDGKALKISFTPAVELSYIRPQNQEYIAVAIEGQQSTPSLAQAQRMRELDQKGILNGDMIDGIMLEEKKEVDKVIISGAELDKYFGKDKTPKEMKEQIIKLLDEWKGKQKEHTRPEKAAAKEK